jgi:hypothetical protein
LDLNLWEKLAKCYTLSTALYGAETWTLRASRSEIPRKFWSVLLEIKKFSWTDRVINGEVLNTVKEERKILRTTKRATRLKCRP